jgi:glycosyltransferase involved in cell wall biosynthesis
MLDTSDANKNFEWLKNPQKTACIIAMSDLVIAGNRYLADYACKHNSRVVVIPTTINTREHRKSDIVKKNNSICIGWSGSITTIKHFGQVVPVLKKIKHKYGDRVRFKVIGDESYVNEELGIKGIAWNLQDEVKELSELDIGLMPLPHDEWAKGKCGLKALLYMAMEIPAVISPVGVNGEIIRDGSNGFLAAKEVEWEQKISRLVESKELRESLGRAGRKTVEEKYSVEVNRSKYLECFRTVLNV